MFLYSSCYSKTTYNDATNKFVNNIVDKNITKKNGYACAQHYQQLLT